MYHVNTEVTFPSGHVARNQTGPYSKAEAQKVAERTQKAQKGATVKVVKK